MVAMFPDVFFHGHVFYYRDAGVFNYPLAFYHRLSFQNGEIPLWNPLNNCGIPFLAQWNGMVLYPFSLIYVLLPVPWSITFFSLGHLLLAGAGMYFLARRWTGNPFAASVAAVAFAWNGLTLHSLMWPNSCASLGWVPWVVLLAESAIKQGGRKIIYASLIGAMQMLAGVPEIILLTWLFAGGVFLVELSAEKKLRGKMAKRLGAIVLLVAGLTAAQMLPFFDLLLHSQRSTGTGADSVWAMPLWGLANYFVPAFHASLSFMGVSMQDEQQWTSSYYFGVAIIALAFLAGRFVREPRVKFLLIATGISAIFALGKNGIVYGWLQQLLPFLGFIRYPVKWVQLIMFSLPLLAAFGITWLQSRPVETTDSSRRNLLGIGTLIVIIIGITVAAAFYYPRKDEPWTLVWQGGLMRATFLFLILGAVYKLIQLPPGWPQRICGGAILILLGMDVFTHAPTQNPTVPGKEYFGVKVQMSKVPHFGEGRAMLSPKTQMTMRYAGSTNAVEDFAGKRMALYYDANLLDMIPKVNGLYSLYIKEQAEIDRELYILGNVSPGLLDFLSVSQMSSPKNLFGWLPRESTLPLVTMGQRPIFNDNNGTLLGLTSEKFDPEKQVYLPPEAEAFITARNFVPGAQYMIENLMPHNISLKTKSQDPALMVVAQTYYHPWTAYIDNLPTRIWRANHAFQAIEVPPGEHDVRFVYEDRIFHLGAFLSLATLVICVFAWVRLKASPVEVKRGKKI